MAFHVPEKHRIRTGPYGSDETYGNNGLFVIPYQGKFRIQVICSDGGYWDHVSVSFVDRNKTPSWDVMCMIKDLFWDDEDVVMQLHPAKSEYVNFHKHCLHLWRPVAAEIPIPPSIMVGPKDLQYKGHDRGMP